MCNLSQGIVEETERETEERIIMNMHESNFTIEQIALATRKTIEEVQAIIENNQSVLV
jgi:predicted transposase YdaD